MDRLGLKPPASLAYAYRGAVYLNLTNRCPTACVFCAKKSWNWRYRGWDLKLGKQEASPEEIVAEAVGLIESTRAAEAVFCGFGEPTSRLDALLETARLLRASYPRLRLRLNTVGLGNLINGRDITGELSRNLDAVSVSLNTADPKQWLALHRPLAAYRTEGYAAVLSFISGCVKRKLDTAVTAVELPGVRRAAVRSLALSLGARFRPRPELRS